MDVMTIWGRSTSSHVRKVVWLLEELGLTYQRHEVGGPFGGTDTDAYRSMQPLGLVPALEEGAFTLFESNTIMRYLCNAHAPTSSFYPAEPRQRAEVEVWMDFQQTALIAPQSVLFQGLVRTAPEKRDHAAIGIAIAEASKIWAILDARLASNDYLAGQGFTLADIVYGPFVHRWFNMAFDRPDAPHLRAWYERLLLREPYRRVCAGPVV